MEKIFDVVVVKDGLDETFYSKELQYFNISTEDNEPTVIDLVVGSIDSGITEPTHRFEFDNLERVKVSFALFGNDTIHKFNHVLNIGIDPYLMALEAQTGVELGLELSSLKYLSIQAFFEDGAVVIVNRK